MRRPLAWWAVCRENLPRGVRGHARVRALTDELCAVSARFRELWCAGTGVGYHLELRHLRHPRAGDLYLNTTGSNAPYPGGDHVVMFRAEPGSDSALSARGAAISPGRAPPAAPRRGTGLWCRRRTSGDRRARAAPAGAARGRWAGSWARAPARCGFLYAARSWQCWPGISAEYYLRLEVGRDKNPSPQVVEALARVLRLYLKATVHPHRTRPPDYQPLGPLRSRRSGRGLDQLIDQLPFPAIVASRYQDVLAANPIAQVPSPGFAPGQNFLRWRLFHTGAPESSTLIGTRRSTPRSMVPQLAGTVPDEPRMQTLIA